MAAQIIGMMQQLFQSALLDKLVKVIPQASTVLGGMTVIFMILTIEISVSLFRVSHHLIGPLEEGLVFYLF